MKISSWCIRDHISKAGAGVCLLGHCASFWTSLNETERLPFYLVKNRISQHSHILGMQWDKIGRMIADKEVHPWKTVEVLSRANEEFKAGHFKKESKREKVGWPSPSQCGGTLRRWKIPFIKGDNSYASI